MMVPVRSAMHPGLPPSALLVSMLAGEKSTLLLFGFFDNSWPAFSPSASLTCCSAPPGVSLQFWRKVSSAIAFNTASSPWALKPAEQSPPKLDVLPLQAVSLGCSLQYSPTGLVVVVVFVQVAPPAAAEAALAAARAQSSVLLPFVEPEPLPPDPLPDPLPPLPLPPALVPLPPVAVLVLVDVVVQLVWSHTVICVFPLFEAPPVPMTVAPEPDPFPFDPEPPLLPELPPVVTSLPVDELLLPLALALAPLRLQTVVPFTSPASVPAGQGVGAGVDVCWSSSHFSPFCASLSLDVQFAPVWMTLG